MSYILEALKKAQAERALGSAPSLHAMPLHPVEAPARSKGAASLWIGLVVGLLVAGSAWMVWRSGDSKAPEAPQPVAPQAAPVATPTPLAPPVKLAPMPSEPSRPVVTPPVAVAAAPQVAPPPAQQAAPQPARAPAAAAALAAPEEKLPTQRELPEAIAREVPLVAIGGYVYASNPADRLLLVDKVLRHEGEELAPGLVLEKLLPKAAVMNYKGYRYKIAY
jgi:general secretion pathway protein B